MIGRLFKKGSGAGSGGTRIPGLKNGKLAQYARIGAIFIGVYLGLYALFAAGEKPRAAAVAKEEIATTHIAAAGAQLDPRESWIGGAGAKVAAQETRLQRQEQNAQAMQERLARLEEELRRQGLAQGASSTKAASPILPVAPIVAAPATTSPAGFPPGTPGSAATQFAGAVGFPVQGVNGSAQAKPPAPPPVRTIGRVRIAAAPTDAKPVTSKTSAGANAPAAERAAGKTFLPVGLVRAEMLGGLDAPTGGQAQQQPLPVLLRITDLAVLPNHFRANVKDCFAVGAGYGDISSERAYIRLESLSCIRKDGQALQVKAKGHVFDETGKLGVRGRLVSKQGQILANALLAGVVSGIGRGIQYDTSTTTVTPFGNTVTQADSGGEFKAGIGEGVGRALDRLANYYISLAEKVFPVIEVDAQRAVDIAFTDGIELDIPLPELAYGAFDDR